MSADMKTLRAALAQCLYTSAAAWAEPLLSDALDELEALRVAAGPAGDIISGVLEERLAKAEAQRDELLTALRRLYDEGEGCAACGKATVPGCGCRYEQAAQALAKAGGK